MSHGASMHVVSTASAAWRLRLRGVAQLLAPDGSALPLDRHGALIAARLALAGPQPREVLARQL
jgi:hypothetical protein